MFRSIVIVSLAAGLAACGPTTSAADGGTDAGHNNNNQNPVDAGPMDAGPVDAGPIDAGPTAADLCASPSASTDCGNCATQSTCVQCVSSVDMSGITQYNSLVSCVLCSACYTTCDSSAGGQCMSAPTMTDTCDTGTPGMSTCDKCQTCAEMGSCSAQVTACRGNSACVDIAQNLQSICGSLP